MEYLLPVDPKKYHLSLYDMIFCNGNYADACGRIKEYIKKYPDAINSYIFFDKKYLLTPLSLACMFSHGRHPKCGGSHIEVVKTLIELGADINDVASIDNASLVCDDMLSRGIYALSPLMMPCRYISTSDISTVRLLLDHGADVNIMGHRCVSNVETTCDIWNELILNENSYDIFQCIFDKFKNTNGIDDVVQTCFTLWLMIFKHTNQPTLDHLKIKKLLGSFIVNGVSEHIKDIDDLSK